MIIKLSDNLAKATGGYSYTGNQVDIAPFTTSKISVMYDNQSPAVVLTEATKQIKVSHWGNIQIDEHFTMENIGAKIKGQFSRFDFDMNEGGKTCLKKLDTVYPHYIKGMYIGDYIGNISTTNAIRNGNEVQLSFRPRYPLCGGWQIDWN